MSEAAGDRFEGGLKLIGFEGLFWLCCRYFDCELPAASRTASQYEAKHSVRRDRALVQQAEPANVIRNAVNDACIAANARKHASLQPLMALTQLAHVSCCKLLPVRTDCYGSSRKLARVPAIDLFQVISH